MPLLLLLLVGCPRPETCDAGEVCLVAGTGGAGFNGEGLPALETDLYLPSDVLLDPDGRLVIVDYNNYRLRRLEADGTLSTIAGNGRHEYATPGAHALQSGFENPIAAELGPDGLLYVAAQHEGRVLRIAADGTLEVVAGTGSLGFSGDGGDPLQAELWDPTGLAFGPDGALYVSDSATNRVRRVHGLIETVVGADAGGEHGPGTAVALDSPQRVTWDEVGERLLIADSFNNRVCAYDPATGLVEPLAGQGSGGYSGDGGAAVDATLDQPQDAVAAPDGTVFVSDARNHVIRAVRPDGTIETVLGTGLPGSVEGIVPADEAALNYPAGLYLTEDGDLYVTSMLSHQVVVWRGAAR